MKLVKLPVIFEVFRVFVAKSSIFTSIGFENVVTNTGNDHKPPANDFKPPANDHKPPASNHKRPNKPFPDSNYLIFGNKAELDRCK